MANIDTQNGPIAETPGEQVSVNDAFAESAFPEAHSENSSEQPQVAPHPAQNQGNVAEPVEQPVETNPVQSSEATNIDNEQRRYQYWQSQAAKMQNQMKEQQAEFQKYAPAIEYLKNNPQAMNPQVQQPQTQTETENTFPPAPEKPKKPRTFSRSDALEDPKSESARYLDDLDGWQDEMENYNTLLTEYNAARMQDEMNEMRNQQKQFFGQQQAYARQEQQHAQAAEYVMANFGATEDDAVGFVKEMSDDKSITLDNLWHLYQINKGQPAQNNAAPPPSPAFQQTQRAQQVPSPMGVMPSQNTEVSSASTEDNIMEGLINAHKAKNPWG